MVARDRVGNPARGGADAGQTSGPTSAADPETPLKTWGFDGSGQGKDCSDGIDRRPYCKSNTPEAALPAPS